MKILIIDNGTSYLHLLQKLLFNHKVDVLNWENHPLLDAENYNLVILSGGHTYSVIYDQEHFENEIRFIKNTNIPLVGICLGCELVAYSFGAKLELLPKREKGLVNIEVIQTDIIFDGLRDFKVYENHKWTITALSNDLIGMAKSDDGYEVIKHKERQICGFQFHPEMLSESTTGERIFNNVFKILELRNTNAETLKDSGILLNTKSSNI